MVFGDLREFGIGVKGVVLITVKIDGIITVSNVS